MEEQFEVPAEWLKALAHPVRLRIVHGLARRNECNVNKMVDHLGLPQSTVSQHLAILKSRGIIKSRKEGLMVCYRVEDDRVRKVLEALDL